MDKNYDVIIDSQKSSLGYWKDVWKFRELFYFLSWRDILVRYKQTLVGISWSIIRPLLTIVIFSIVFGKIANLPANGIPYVLLVSAGILPWQFFAASFSEASNSLVNNSNMLSKVYFPRIIIPVSSIIVAMVDFFISLIILAGCMIWYKYVPGTQILFLPLFILQAIIVSAGTGLLIAALNVKYRDFRYIVPFIIQIGLYISPVGFSSTVIPEKYKLLYALNPMVGVIDGFRWSILNGPAVFLSAEYYISLAVSIIFLAVGFSYFRKIEHNFADII